MSNYIASEFIPVYALTDYKNLKKINNLFKTVKDLLEKYNITYWIHSGTLLGAIRNKCIIPWDDDVDITILEKDIQNFLNLKIELNKLNIVIVHNYFGFRIYDKNGEIIKPQYKFKFPFIDVFVAREDNYIIKYISPEALNKWNNDYFTHDELYPLKKYQFEDYEVYGPQNPYNYLDRLYPNWKNIAIKTFDHITYNKVDKFEFNINYNDSNKYYIWQYWEGNMPDYIKLCMETVDKHCDDKFNIIRLNPDNIKDYLPELINYEDKINKLTIPHKVDIYRIMLLYKYGGIYMDADVIVLRDISEITDKLKEHDYVGFGCTGDNCKNGYGEPSNWILASRQNTILMGNILNNLLKKLKKIKNKDRFDYHDLGKFVIWNELENLIKDDYKYYHYPNTVDGTRDINGDWVTSDLIFSNEKIKYDDEQNMMFLIIYNSELDDKFKKMSKNDILNQDWNYSKFIKKSLE
jgi:phosphorylcholine metabolism protein LicD